MTGNVAKASPYVALYCRISRDKQGRLEGVGRQEKWGRDYAARAWPGVPVHVFADNNLTAFDDDVERPDYERLRAAVRAGEVAHVWAVEQTRLEASRRRWIDLVVDLDEAGIGEIHTDRDGIVRLDEVADIKNVFAHHERKRLRKRVNDTLRDLAESGRPPGGRAFGYRHGAKPDGERALYVVEDEAEAIRWSAQAVLSGLSATAIAAELEGRGVKTARGGKWTHSNVKGMLTNPRVAGLRTYRGEVLRKGNWEPILDEVTWRQVCALLNGSRVVPSSDGGTRRVGGRRNTGRRYLLTGGIARCGRTLDNGEVCGAQLVARQQNGRGGKRGIYACVSGPYNGCNRLGINAAPLEEYVVGLLFEWLSTEEFGASLAADDDAEDRERLTRAIRDVDDRRVRLSTRWSRGELDDAEWDAARAELLARKEAMVAELAEMPAPAGGDVDPEQLAADWTYLHLDEKRAVISQHVASVVVLPATPGAKAFDPGRVRVRFVGQAD